MDFLTVLLTLALCLAMGAMLGVGIAKAGVKRVGKIFAATTAILGALAVVVGITYASYEIAVWITT